MLLILLAALTACSTTPAPQPTMPTVLLRGGIGYGQTVSSSLADRETRWLFDGQSGDVIRVRLDRAGAQVTLAILQSDGEAIARARGLVTALRLPESGQYAIVLPAVLPASPQTTSPDGADYALSLELIQSAAAPTATLPTIPTSPPAGRPIRIGETQRGAITAGDEVHLWTFEGTAGQIVTLRGQALSAGFDPVISLFGPDRAELAKDDNSGGGPTARDAQIGGFALPVRGAYYVQVWGNGRIGDYALSLTEGVPLATSIPTPRPTFTPPPGPTALPTLTATPYAVSQADATFQQAQIGQPIAGQISQPDQADRLAVFGPAGAVISVGMFPETGSTLIPTFEIYAPDGEQVGTATGRGLADPNAGADVAAGGALFSGYTLPATGAYIIFARGAQGTTGAYSLVVGDSWTLREVGGGQARLNMTYRGALLRAGDRETWTIDLPQNATFYVEAAPEQPDFNPVIEVIAPDGAQIAAVRGGPGGTAVVQGVVTPAPGKYKVRITAFLNESIGSYLLSARVLNVQPTPTFGPVTQSHEVTVSQGERFVMSFNALSGSLLRVEAQALAAFDPVVEVYGPSGRRIAVADDLNADNAAAILQMTLADGDGVYTVRVFGYALMPGAFRLLVQTE